MQSRLLQSFLTVAECGSITEAAEKLHVSQPALTKSIQKLELDLGVSLFERAPTGVALTRYGAILQHHAKIMQNEYRHALASIEELRTGRTGAVRIGAGPVWLVSILPPIIAAFQRKNPGIKVSLVGGVIDTLVPDLLRGDLDIICVSLDFPNRAEIAKHPMINVRHALIADPTHPLAQRRDINPSAIHGYPWMVLKSDHVGNERIGSFFSVHGLSPPNIALETTSIHSLLQGLRDGNSVAHIPEQMLPLAESVGLERLHLNETIWETTAGYALRKSARLTLAVRKFIDVLSAQLPTHEPPSNPQSRR